MGIENNEAICATTWHQDSIAKIEKWIDEEVPEEFQELFVTIPSIINGKCTIVFAPCGSKKGWDTDHEAEEIRDSFIFQLESCGGIDYDIVDGERVEYPWNYWDWVEVGYGEYGQKILRGNCKNQYNDEEYATDG